MSMRSLKLAVLALAVLLTAPALAQDKPADNMQILRDKVRADKKLLVAQNMALTEAEAKGFWPIYEGYQRDLDAINARLSRVIQSYAQAYKGDALTDEKAKPLLDEALAVEEAEAQLRKSYATKLGAVLPAKKVARYLQIEGKIRAAIRYELAAGIPLVQ
jgi:hypothetical protein